jgi:hypothetical protein
MSWVGEPLITVPPWSVLSPTVIIFNGMFAHFVAMTIGLLVQPLSQN